MIVSGGMNVPIARTSLNEDEIASVLEPLMSGWLVQGPKTREFEEKWSAFTGAEHSIAVTSCTSGLHLSLAALGIGPGDEVIVPAFTWISTANVVEHLGAKVVFCDIDLLTFNINTVQIGDLVSNRTRALLPVHLFGLASNMDTVIALANEYELAVVEDAACGFGSRFGGQHVGTFGSTGCFSFHPRKAITTGEGGMITTQNSELATQIRRLRDHGAVVSDLQRHLGPKPYLLADHHEAGYNQRMTDIQGALGSAQMDRAEGIIDERQKLAARYDEAFKGLLWLQTPHRDDLYTHGYQSYPCLFKPEETKAAAQAKEEITLKALNQERNSWMEELQQKGISTRPSTHAVHMLTYYKTKYALDPLDFPMAFAANHCSISLPLFHGMTMGEQDYVIDVVLSRAP